MSEFIGSRISLISKSDIKYVGTLHEINSENSTVALENVKSFGTEGRRGNPDEEIPPSDQIYDYIVFRGTDVKDLTIVEAPKENKPPQPPQPPNDPAILGAARPHPSAPPQQQHQQPPPQHQHQQPNQQWRGPQPPQFPPYGYPPPPQNNSRFAPPGGLHGFPGAPGAVPGYGMPPYGPPQGWYPPPGQGPPGQGFPQGPPGPFSPHPPNQMPIGPPGMQNQSGPQQAPIGSGPKQPTPSQDAGPQAPPVPESKPTESSTTPAPSAQAAPPPPNESKPDVAAALAPPEPPAQTKPASAPKNNRIAVPLPNPNARNNAPLQSKPGNAPPTSAPPPTAAATTAAQQQQSASQAAAAAVAAAMAKLGPLPAHANKQSETSGDAVDNLTKKVGEMRTDERVRNSRQPGTGGYAAGHRGGRGGRRPSTREQTKPVEVPQADFDFESSNAKFNKQDLVKEAIATGSPLGTPTGEDGGVSSPPNGALNGGAPAGPEANGHGDDVVIPNAKYNKSTSFFDNISSELKDRQTAQDEGKRLGGMEFRTEERRKNMETFGQSNVDTGYRGGFRGRGRGRGFGGRGRGFSGPRGGFGGRGRGRGGADAANAETFG